MDYLKLKREIKEIADIAASVPDAFKEKCFEVLLNHLISDPSTKSRSEGLKDDKKKADEPKTDLPITTQLRVFMSKTKITVDEIKAILMVADDDVHFVKEPKVKSIAAGQIEWALLLALKNCILNDSLTVDPESVRSVCQDKGCYNSANFTANFKNNAGFFKGLMKKQGEAQGLTTEGQNELAKVIRELAKPE